MRTTISRVLAAGALVVVTACSSARAADAPAAGPVAPDLPVAETLAAAASDRVAALCESGPDSLEPDPDAYRQETWAALTELVGRAALPDDEDDPDVAREAALAEVRARWRGDLPSAGDRPWDRTATASVACADGHLYAVQVLARTPGPVDAGAYGRARMPESAVTHLEGVRYGTAPDVAGRPVDLVLDLFLPDPAVAGVADRPLLVLIHGGGFVTGSRTQHVEEALAYARRGFVTATIDYRIDPDADQSVAAHRTAAFAATDDGRRAMRWLRSHADDLGVDPDRIAVLGASAGGTIALGLALLEDPTPERSGDDMSAQPTAAFSTGAFLTPVLGAARLDEDDAPVLLHHFETDTTSGRAWTYAAATCDAARAAGVTCDLAISEGVDHIVGLGPASAEFDRILGFLAVHLRLDG